MGWYAVGAGLIVVGVAALVFGSGLASANQKLQDAMWGRTFWSTDSAARYSAGKNKVVGAVGGAVAVCVGAAVLIARAVTH